MTDCAFCAVVAEDAPAHRVHEGDRAHAFLDSAPAAPGHALVVPTAHRERLTAMAPDRVAELFRTVRRVAAAVETAVDADGTNVLAANGPAAGQEVPHAHVHVVPRFEGDDVTLQWTTGDLDDGTGKHVASAIRAEL